MSNVMYCLTFIYRMSNNMFRNNEWTCLPMRSLYRYINDCWYTMINVKDWSTNAIILTVSRDCMCICHVDSVRTATITMPFLHANVGSKYIHVVFQYFNITVFTISLRSSNMLTSWRVENTEFPRDTRLEKEDNFNYIKEITQWRRTKEILKY